MSCLAYDMNISWQTANGKCHTEIIFFPEKRVVGHTTFHFWLTGQQC